MTGSLADPSLGMKDRKQDLPGRQDYNSQNRIDRREEVMRKQLRRMAAAAAVVSLMMTVSGQAGEIGDFLTGGNGNTETAMTGTAGDFSADTTSAAAQSLNMVSCTDSQTGIDVARAVVPDNYSVTSETTWCGGCQSPSYPASVYVDAKSPDGSIEMTYESPLAFVHHLYSYANGLDLTSHQDYALDTDLVMMMLTYMNAQQFCDYIAQNYVEGAANMTFVSEEPVSQEVPAVLDQCSQQLKDASNQFYASAGANNMYVDLVETTVAERTYSYTDTATGKQKYLIVSAAVQGSRTVSDFSSYGMGEVKMANVVWEVPARYCLMCDADRFEEGKAVFDSFCSNTTISDQFKQAMSDLSDRIMQIVLEARSGGGTGGLEIASGTILDSFSSELSGQDDSYSSIEAWDDVIMDRNDYTLSNGDSVKVDTSYDYVYELSDGNVYATDSALDEPAGGTLLYAN